MSDGIEATPVYFHDCPAFGPHTRLPRALLFEPGPGITVNLDGSYTVDTKLAEKLI